MPKKPLEEHANQINNQSINDILKDRQDRYGDFKKICYITEALMNIIEKADCDKYNKLTTVHKESIRAIFNKIARVINGDPFYLDSIKDIAGYAMLLHKYIEGLINE